MTKYHNIKKAWSIIKNERKYIILLCIFGLFFSTLTSVIPAFIGIIVASIGDFKFRQAFLFSVFVIFIYLFSAIISVFYTKLYCITKNKIIFSLRKKLFEKILDLECKEFDEHTTGLFLTRMTDDPKNIVNVFNDIRLNITRGLANMGVIIYIFILNWIIGIVYVISFVFIYSINSKGIGKFINKKKVYLNQLENSTTVFGEIVKGIKDIKVLDLKDSFIKKSENAFQSVNCADTDFQVESAKYYALSDLMQQITSIFVVMLGIIFVYYDMLTITFLLVIFMYRDSVYDLLRMISSLKESFQNANVSIERMFEIIESENYKTEVYGNTILTNSKGKIEFKNVSFGYKRKLILKDLNFVVDANDTVAIVGKSGVGKSTLFNLLTKSYNVNDGAIFIDDISICDLDEKSIKNNISMISQNPYIFNMTILDNLKLVKPEATKEEIINVCKLSQIHDFILSLDKQYDTVIGEGGINLSGGQKQRLAIARALLRDSKIILFDEATSALDNETQKKILKSIQNISKNHTIIIIAHRLSTIKKCSKILVMNKGKIIATGRHNQLLQNCSLYARLYKNEFIDS